MAPEIVRPDGGDAAPDPSREVEFALMLSRVIDSVEKNPEFLRATVYELARHKLKEEFTSESFGNVRNLLRERRSYRPILRTNMSRPLSSQLPPCSKPMSSDLAGRALGRSTPDS